MRFFVNLTGVLLLAFVLFASMFAGFRNLNLLAAMREPVDPVSRVMEVLGFYLAVALGLGCALWRPEKSVGGTGD